MGDGLKALIIGKRNIVLDSLALAALFALLTYFAAKFEVFDAFVRIAERHKDMSLEDFATGLFVMSSLLLVFALRRWADLRMEVAASKVEEQKLRITQKELEKLVGERTRELVLANEQLEREVAERKLAQDRLEYRAFYDQLTDLPNRALFMNRLEELFKHKERYPDFRFAVLFMDIDRFKVINDSLGHLIGDQLLIMVGHRLKGCLRPVDTVARFGGDEFAILLKGIKDLDDVDLVADRVRELMKEPFSVYGQEVFASVSIGVAHCEMSYYDRPAEIIRDADIAMYKAKENGGAGHVVFDSDMHAQVVMALEVETDLRNAIARKEFRVYYQPLVRIADASLAGFEALLRWEHPERGLLLPEEFLLVAEDTGLIVPIGRWVLREACSQMRRWQEQYPAFRDLTVSVNLSGREFVQPGFVDEIGTALKETGLDPGSLRLEITERMIVTEPEYASLVLKRLKQLGVWLDIDDFGTGHSALSNLRDFPVDSLKIDRSFISSLAADEQNVAIVKTIVSLADTLKLSVVAEGVENEEQLSLTRGMKCGYAQGFYYHRPMDAATAEGILEKEGRGEVFGPAGSGS
ncbi:MAG: EAL domain-containing protein [Nitrospirota bacterium]|jgi:diguanylate cyclase (GGDEF)-like protein